MNVGQILETHMGWAARGLGLKIDEALKDYRRSGDMTPVREAVRLAYGDETYEEAFAEPVRGRLPGTGRQCHQRRADCDAGV